MQGAVKAVGVLYLAAMLIRLLVVGVALRQLHLMVPPAVLPQWALPPSLCLAASYWLISRGRFGAATLPLIFGWYLLFYPYMKIATCGTCGGVIAVSYGW